MNIISKKGYGILPVGRGFFFTEYKDGEIEFYYYYLGKLVRKDLTQYCEAKYGIGYRNILKYVEGDIVSPITVITENGQIIVSDFKNPIVYIFDAFGQKVLETESMNNYGNIYSMVYENGHIWCTYPTEHIIVKYSLDSFNEIVKVGGNTAFDHPEHVSFDNRQLYVCDMGNKRICAVDISFFSIMEYKAFNEPIFEYHRIMDRDVFKLSSGIYLL